MELEIFLSAVFSGVFLFALYFSLEMLRKLKKHPLWLLNVEDAFYWSVTLGYLFVQIYHTNDGNLRGYYVLGIVLGAFASWKIFRFLAKTWKNFVHSKGQKKVD